MTPLVKELEAQREAIWASYASALTCSNCGASPLGLSSLYCAECVLREGESWYAWRLRLARKRKASS